MNAKSYSINAYCLILH